ncbi:MAG: 5-dehydro-4-deoxy-D-glucuronate isomerase [Spirochaetales bacterium]
MMSTQMVFETRYSIHPEHGKQLDTEGLRKEFLIQRIFVPGTLKWVYSHTDRIIVGGCIPLKETPLEIDPKILGATFLLERRELGVLNLGGAGQVWIEGTLYPLQNLDALYIGKGNRNIRISSSDSANPAKFYLLSGMAHQTFPSRKITFSEARKVPLGSQEEANKRTIYQILHPEVIPTCNLVMGFTRLEPGSVWNTMPTHTHERRMEVYLYFDMAPDTVVFHLMGSPTETRHLVVRNEEAVLSPSWSIHSGVGTKNYSFVWGMVGENQTFTDMDAVPMQLLR